MGDADACTAGDAETVARESCELGDFEAFVAGDDGERQDGCGEGPGAVEVARGLAVKWDWTRVGGEVEGEGEFSGGGRR